MENNKTHNLLVYSEQIKLLYASSMHATIIAIIASLLMVAIQWDVIEHSVLLGWLLIFWLVSFCRGLLGFIYHRKNIAADDAVSYFTKWRNDNVIADTGSRHDTGIGADIIT